MKLHITLLILIVLSVGFLVWYTQGGEREVQNPFVSGSGDMSTIHIGIRAVQVEIADSEEERGQGLSGRESLGENSGLLFVFDEPGHHGIWMKDMRFPIDIIWIAPSTDTSSSGGGSSAQYRIVDIKKGAHPESYPEVFRPRGRASHVLEVNAGYTEIYNIEIGDLVRL